MRRTLWRVARSAIVQGQHHPGPSGAVGEWSLLASSSATLPGTWRAISGVTPAVGAVAAQQQQAHASTAANADSSPQSPHQQRGQRQRPQGGANGSSSGAGAQESNGGDRRRRRRRDGGSGGGGQSSRGEKEAETSELLINLTSQLERNYLERHWHKVVDLFEGFMRRGRTAAASQAAAAAEAAAAAAEQLLQRAEDPQATPAAGSQVTAGSSDSGSGSGGGAAARKGGNASPVITAAELPPEYRPDRRCFSLYYRSLKHAHLARGTFFQLDTARVQAMLDLESQVTGSATPSREGQEALLASLCAWHNVPHKRLLELFDKTRAAGGGLFFPFYRHAIESSLALGQVERAGGLLREVLNGACASAVMERARFLEPFCSRLAAAHGRRGELTAAVGWLQTRAQLREQLVRAGQGHLTDSGGAAAAAATGADGAAAAAAAAAGGGRGDSGMLQRRQQRQQADVDLYLDLMDSSLRRGHAAAGMVLLRMAAEQPVLIEVKGKLEEHPPLFDEARLVKFLHHVANDGPAANLEAAEFAWEQLRRSAKQAAELGIEPAPQGDKHQEQQQRGGDKQQRQQQQRGAEKQQRQQAVAEGAESEEGAAGSKAAASGRPVPSPEAYQAMASAALAGISYGRAWEIAREMISEHAASQPSVASVFRGLAFFPEALNTEAKVHEAFAWLEAERAAGRPLPTPLMNVLLRAIARLNDNASAAARAFEAFPLYGAAHDVDSYNCIMESCAAAGKIAAIQGLMAHMKEQGIRPNGNSYSELLRACHAAGDLRTAYNVMSTGSAVHCWLDAFVLKKLLVAAHKQGHEPLADLLAREMGKRTLYADLKAAEKEAGVSKSGGSSGGKQQQQRAGGGGGRAGGKEQDAAGGEDERSNVVRRLRGMLEEAPTAPSSTAAAAASGGGDDPAGSAAVSPRDALLQGYEEVAAGGGSLGDLAAAAAGQQERAGGSS